MGSTPNTEELNQNIELDEIPVQNKLESNENQQVNNQTMNQQTNNRLPSLLELQTIYHTLVEKDKIRQMEEQQKQNEVNLPTERKENK